MRTGLADPETRPAVRVAPRLRSRCHARAGGVSLALGHCSQQFPPAASPSNSGVSGVAAWRPRPPAPPSLRHASSEWAASLRSRSAVGWGRTPSWRAAAGSKARWCAGPGRAAACNPARVRRSPACPARPPARKLAAPWPTSWSLSVPRGEGATWWPGWGRDALGCPVPVQCLHCFNESRGDSSSAAQRGAHREVLPAVARCAEPRSARASAGCQVWDVVVQQGH